MSIIKSSPKEKIINGIRLMVPDIVIVSEKNYKTDGEGIVIVKITPSCKIILDNTTTERVSIKSFTNVLVIPFMGKIDEEYDEIQLHNGSCVEFAYCSGGWYIISSDGLKFNE
jgi:hypothetical protein